MSEQYPPTQSYPTGAPPPGMLPPVGSEWIEQDEAGNPVVWRHYSNRPMQPPQPNDPGYSAWRNLSHGYPPDGLPIPPRVQPSWWQRNSRLVRRFVSVLVGGLGVALGITGLEFADYHEPSLANALAGHQLYSDAGTIRILSIFLMALSIALLIWEFVRRRR
jgi:hypothetical protein